jgi:hypothetical protein
MIVSSCRKALQDGCYKWRHDRVLAVLAHHMELQKKMKRSQVGKKPVQFVKAGGKTSRKDQPTTTVTTGVLQTAQDWEMRVDLKKKLVFPGEITTTSLRPDIVLYSKVKKHIILIELTVPLEESK